MSKQNKKLVQEIQNGLKQVDEGIAQLEMLEVKVENASTISIKEKYRQDMKREIKRLQRLRDIFRQNINNPAIQEQHRLVEARKRIETEMEKFRDHEKEYKSKKPTKAAMLNETEIKGKFNYGSGSSFEGDYGEDCDDIGEASDDDINEDSDTQDINIDKQWLAGFVTDTLRNIMTKYDEELDKIQNKKTKGGQKKNRDKINALKNKKSHFQHIKDRAEELQISMDYLEPGKIRQLRVLSKQLNTSADEEPVRLNVLQEIDNLIELSEQNRRTVHNPSSGGLNLGPGQNQSDAGRSPLDQLDLQSTDDIVEDGRPITALRVGNILDAQDYLASWHLSIVIDDGTSTESSQINQDQRTLHFLPFSKANRDEVFSIDDQARLAPAFTKQDAAGEPQTQILTLQNYLEAHLRKTGQNPASFQNKHLRNNNFSNYNLQSLEETKNAQMRGQQQQLKQGRNGASDQNNTTSNSEKVRNGMSTQQMQTNLQLQKGKHSNKLSSQTVGPHEGDHKHKTGGLRTFDQSNTGLPSYNNNQQHFTDSQTDQANLMQNNPNMDEFKLHGADFNSRELPRQEQHAEIAGGINAPMFTNSFQGLGAPLPDSGIDSQDLYSMSSTLDRQLNSNEQQVLLQNPALGTLGGANSQPIMVKDTSLSERKHNLDLLETSFNNILTKQDQEVIDPKQPVSVWEEHDYPRVPLFNRKENFSRFDLETLFFAFYYQQGTYQQYLAAVELKKKNWKFVKKFETWFKKVEGDNTSASGNPATAASGPTASSSLSGSNSAANPDGGPGGPGGNRDLPQEGASGATTSAQKDVGKYIFFDFENGWQQFVRDDFELDLSQIENELIVQPAATSAATSTAPGGNPVTAPATGHTGAPTATATTTSSGAPSRTTHAQ